MTSPPTARRRAGRADRAWKTVLLLVAAGVGAAAAQPASAALPRLWSPDADAAAGFALCLAPVAWLVWVLCSQTVSTRRLLVVIAVDFAVGMLLARGGWFVAAVPFQVVAAAGLGIVLAGQVAAAWWLAAFAGVAILADAWSVFLGPTKQVVERAPQVLGYVLVHFTPIGGPLSGLGLGLSDLVFLALFLAGSRRLGLNAKVGYAAMLASLVVTVILAVWWRPAVPALPLLSLAFLLVNLSRWAALLRRRGTTGRTRPQELAPSAGRRGAPIARAHGQALRRGPGPRTRRPLGPGRRRSYAPASGSNRPTASMCGVWGNMSTGVTRRRR